jgi:hypothetical protein
MVFLGVVGWYAVAGYYLIQGTADPPPAPRAPTKKVQDLSRPRSLDAGYLPLQITEVYTNASPSNAAPWHTNGGNWTFFDCAAGRFGKVHFTVGLRDMPQTGNEPITWNEGLLGVAVADDASGADLVQLVAESFHQPLPEKRTGRPAGVIRFSVAVLGTARTQQAGGGFVAAPPGDWTTTRLFIDVDGYAAQVYFNYNVREKRGEFSEYSPDCRPNLLLQLAAGLRDGPLPERTLENDPNLTPDGPQFTDWQMVARGRLNAAALSADGRHLFYVRNYEEGPSAVGVADVDKPDRGGEVARFSHRLGSLRPLPGSSGNVLVIEYVDAVTDKPALGPRQLLRLLDPKTGNAEEIRGSWGETDWSLGPKAISPDGRFVVLSKWTARPGSPLGDLSLHVLDLGSRKTVVLTVPNQSLTLAAWKGEASALKALVFTGFADEANPSVRRAYLADPLTGRLDRDPTPPAELDTLWTRSPDGLRKAEFFAPDELRITDLASGARRTFTLHPADQGYLEGDQARWVSSRYLFFAGRRPALIDADTLKMNFPMPKDDTVWPEAFTPDFAHVVGRSPGGLFIGRVVIPGK